MERLLWPGDACYIQVRHNDLLSQVEIQMHFSVGAENRKL